MSALRKFFDLPLFYSVVAAILAKTMAPQPLTELQDWTMWFCARWLGGAIGRIIVKLRAIEKALVDA